VRHRFCIEPAPETPRFWHDLEGALSDAAVTGVRVPDIDPTPVYERVLDRTLIERAPVVARRESLPVTALAATAALVVALAGFLALGPRAEVALTSATPGVETTTTLAATVSAEQMVVNSFQRWVDGRSEAERLTTRYRNQGYDVVVQELNVAEPTLHGEVLEVRHGGGATSTTVAAQARGQVILVVGRSVAAGPNVGS